MYKMKLGFTALLVVASLNLFAQGVHEAKKHIHAKKHNTAKHTLRKALEADPNNPELVYWLAQAYFDHKDPKGAKDVLLKHMGGALGNNPLLLVAMGQVELTENKPNDARQKFETAISLTKGKDIAIFTAIGKANLEQGGDPAYGIEKLKLATAIKGFKDPMTYIYMGDLYRAIQNGGGAVSSYENALVIDPKMAMAKHKIGKIYLTQGSESRDIFLQKFSDAILDDPTFTPALYDMYVFYFSRDVNKAIQYFNDYKKHAEPGPALDYEEASLQFASANFQNAIAKSDDLLKSQGDSADPRLYRLKAYSYDKLGDSIQALANLETFFQKVKSAEDINPENYLIAAFNAAKQKTDPAKVDYYFTKAIDADTLIENKVDYTRKAADFFKRTANTAKSAEWLVKVLAINPKQSKVDLYNAGFENFKATEYKRADSIFSIYKTVFPNEVYGHYWSFRSLSVVDSTMELGLAVPDCEKFISIAEADKVKNKSTLITAYGYLAGYSANIKKDLAGAAGYLEKIIEIDPNNQDAIKNRDIIQKALAAPKK
jgi:tetratricopeptide (TPR) repeat protein